MGNITYQINPDIIWKDADDTIYILQPDREEIHALNETGTLIWKLIGKGYSLTKVKTEFLYRYKVTASQAEKDIQEFINRYVMEKFLTTKNIKPKKK